MKYDPEKHHRRSIRIPGYDYSQGGMYFVTICTRDRECLFGDMVDGGMRLNKFGYIVHEEWEKSVEIREEIELDAFVVMPNHIHGVVIITVGNVGATGRSPLRSGPPKRSLGALVGGLKSAVTKRINDLRGTPGIPIWQPNYYEHIIRNAESLTRIRQYIFDNPARWAFDRENPAATTPETAEPWRV